MSKQKPSNLEYIVEHAAALAAAGVRVISAGMGADAVQVEFGPAPPASLPVRIAREILPESALGGSSEPDHERAGEDTAQGTSDEGHEQAADDLDLAHLDDSD